MLYDTLAVMQPKTDLPNTIFTGIPQLDSSIFVGNNVTIEGDVTIGKDSSIWHGAVLRGDINSIQIGARTNIQDLSMIHLENDLPCIVGNDVTVGHRAILHACTIEDGALIGMGAIVLNGVVVKKGAVIGAGAVVKEHTVVEANSLWVGVPAKHVKDCDDSQYEKNCRWAKKYVELAKTHMITK